MANEPIGIPECREQLSKLDRDALFPGFESHHFWRILPRFRAFALFAAMDSMMVAFQHIAREVQFEPASSGAAWQHRKEVEEGFVLAVRSLSQHDMVRVESPEDLPYLDAAGSFLRQCSVLFVLETVRRQALDGLFSVDQKNGGSRYVFTPRHRTRERFSPPSAFLGLSFSDRALREQTEWWAAEENAWTSCAPPVFFAMHGRLQLLHADRLGRLRNPSFFASSCPSDLWGIDPKRQIGDTRIDEVLIVMACVRRWANIAMRAYLMHADCDRDQERISPVQITSISRLCNAVRLMSGLSFDATRRVLEHLVYRPECKRRDPFVTPFIVSGDTVMWSSYVLMQTQPVRNYLKASLNNQSTRQEAVKVIGDRAAFMAEHIADRFTGHGYVACANIAYRQGGHVGDIDVMLWHGKSPQYLVLIECKAQLTPDSWNELRDARDHRENAEAQLDKSRQFFKQMSRRDLATRFTRIRWSDVRYACGIVCMLQGLPPQHDKKWKYPVCTLDVLVEGLATDQFRSTHALMRILMRKDRSTSSSAVVSGWREYRCDGVVFEVPQLEIASDSDAA